MGRVPITDLSGTAAPTQRTCDSGQVRDNPGSESNRVWEGVAGGERTESSSSGLAKGQGAKLLAPSKHEVLTLVLSQDGVRLILQTSHAGHLPGVRVGEPGARGVRSPDPGAGVGVVAGSAGKVREGGSSGVAFLKSSQRHHIARPPSFRNEEPEAGEEVTWLRRLGE